MDHMFVSDKKLAGNEDMIFLEKEGEVNVVSVNHYIPKILSHFTPCSFDFKVAKTTKVQQHILGDWDMTKL